MQGRLRGSGCKDAKDLQAPGGKGIGQGVATTLRRNLFQIVKLRLCRQRLRGTGCRVERVERLERLNEKRKVHAAYIREAGKGSELSMSERMKKWRSELSSQPLTNADLPVRIDA